MEKTKRRRGDRRDGRRVHEADPMHLITPYLLGDRIENEAVLNRQFDLSRAEEYLAEKNAANPQYKYTLFHLITAAVAKTIYMRPLLNRFIIKKRLYARNEISFSFVAKNKFTDNGGESLVLMRMDETSGKPPIEQVHDRVCSEVYKVRDQGQENGTGKTMGIITSLPGWLISFAIGTLRRLDEHGHLPRAIERVDPYRSTVFISNLGSIRMSANYHHLTNWGTNSVFIIIGEAQSMPRFCDDGSVRMHPALELGISIDERIADGFYFARSVKLLDAILQHPEVLDEPLDAPFAWQE